MTSRDLVNDFKQSQKEFEDAYLKLFTVTISLSGLGLTRDEEDALVRTVDEANTMLNLLKRQVTKAGAEALPAPERVFETRSMLDYQWAQQPPGGNRQTYQWRELSRYKSEQRKQRGTAKAGTAAPVPAGLLRPKAGPVRLHASLSLRPGPAKAAAPGTPTEGSSDSFPGMPPSSSSRQAGARGGRGGSSRPLTELPEKDFSYGQRPWDTFRGRRDAIFERMGDDRESFTVLEVCTWTGYFSVELASAFPQSDVTAEFMLSGGWEEATLDWTAGWPNLNVGTVGFDCKYVQSLKQRRAKWDVMLLLSVFHYIDFFSDLQMQYPADNPQIEGAVSLMADIFSLADLVFIELPNRGDGDETQELRMVHLYKEYGTVYRFLKEAVERLRRSGVNKIVEEEPIYKGVGKWDTWLDNQSTRWVYVVRDCDASEA